ncbi:MAG: glutamate 5-kinase [Clostridia bacterium]|nr:glutamate 5-kinase [Clostridia bacterium]
MAVEETLRQAKRLVIKVGTSSLTYPTGKINLNQMERLVKEMADILNQAREMVLVTSGAVGAGMGRLGWDRHPKTMPEKQAAAAVGQGLLLHMYEKFFSEFGYVVAQVLLTREDLADRKRYLNARHTLMKLLEFGVIPIINENDTIAVEEIRFGDNDTLAALVAGLVDADLLILLTDTGGLYTADPRQDKNAKIIPVIEEITPEIEALAQGKGSRWATGGMVTKIQAAKIAVDSCIPMVIASGFEPWVMADILSGKLKGSLFVPREGKVGSKKRWIAFSSDVAGGIYVDPGAEKAIADGGKSLLPSGIVDVEGDFEAGSVVSIFGASKQEFARGIVNYSSREIGLIKGKKTSEIASILGHKDYDEVIHRDNLCLKH